MVSLSTASAESTTTPKKGTRSPGEIALSKISIAWKGNSLLAARNAAYDIGELIAGGWLAHHKGDEFWKRRFAVQLIDEKWWSTVHEAFQSGRGSLATIADLQERYFTVAASNSPFFVPTVFEWEDPANIPVRDWIYGNI